ncbi:MAG: AAA family ATPase [Cyanobacteria bacterium P01_E01_bin.6]
MNSESPPPAPVNFVKQTTETVAHVLRWIAELIWRRNWFMLLVLTGVVLSIGGHVAKDTINQWLPDGSHDPFWQAIGLAAVLMFISAVIVAVVTMPRSTAPTAADIAERRAIKGLRPFGFDDADIFSRLQRRQSLQECVDVVTSQPFRFGILMGESGCGKTSFLQAGVWPTLSRPEGRHRGIYIRFSDEDPIETIRKALADQLELPVDWLTDTEFLSLLTHATEATGKPVVLLLDQFEQFFVHSKRSPRRQTFVEALTAWYHSPIAQSVKILVSIRSDLFYYLVDLQKSLGCALGPHDVIHLEKFSPQEATAILSVIAETEQLQFDGRFVEELAEQELAHPEDGLISPVDLQILAWMIERQHDSGLKAFNRDVFQKFGGVVGLLARFLEKALAAQVNPAQRQAAVKVLVALTDLDKQVRAGVLTQADLQTKLGSSLGSSEVMDATHWLARGDVRLITPIERPDTVGYELAHERLIPALLKLEDKVISEVDQVNQLLDRRVNIWEGNQYDRRYLLNWRELWRIEQQKANLAWGTKRRQKERLLARSRRWVYGAAGVVATLLAAALVFSSWLYVTPQGQIQQASWQLKHPIGSRLEYRSDAEVARAAMAFVKLGDWNKGFDLEQQYINRSSDQSYFVQEVARIAPRLLDDERAKILLSRALSIANTIDNNPLSKSNALTAIATAYRELGDASDAVSSLEAAMMATQAIDEPSAQSNALSAIATAYGELGDASDAVSSLEAAMTATQAIDDPSAQSLALRAIATAYGALGNANDAVTILEAAMTATQAINEPGEQSHALRAIVFAAGDLGDRQMTVALLETIRQEADRINASSALQRVAVEYARLHNWGKAVGTLRTANEQNQIAGLTQILSLRAEQQHPALIDGAVVLAVEPKEEAGSSIIEVTVHSPDPSCDQYVDWWEILSEDGKTLIYQSEFLSFPLDDEPLMVNTSPPLQLKRDQVLFVRAHQHITEAGDDYDPATGQPLPTSGYAAEQAMKGSIAKGFTTVRIPETFGKGLAQDNPQPLSCNANQSAP